MLNYSELPLKEDSYYHSMVQMETTKYLAFFIVHLSHPYMTTEKIIALTIWTFIGKVMSLLYNMLSRFIISFLPRNKNLLISWL